MRLYFIEITCTSEWVAVDWSVVKDFKNTGSNLNVTIYIYLFSDKCMNMCRGIHIYIVCIVLHLYMDSSSLGIVIRFDKHILALFTFLSVTVE